MKRIGLLIERHWHYGRRLCEGIASFAREHGDLSLEFLDWDDAGRHKNLCNFDGFIARIWNQKIGTQLAATKRPVIDVYGGAPAGGAVSVDQNARLIGQLAARHFIEHRFTRFAFCGYACQNYSLLRRAAFVHALELNLYRCEVFEDTSFTPDKFGLKVLEKGGYDAGISTRALAKWLRSLEKPVAIFCAHDLVALSLVNVCRSENIGIPRDVAVLGVDDDPLLCDFTNPTISSIDPNPFGIGYEAAKCLSSWIADPRHKPSDKRPAPLGLTERVSTQIYTFHTPWISDALVFIRRNVARNINAEDVFRHLKLSHTTVEHGFKNELDTTVNREIARLRLEEAKRLLSRTSLPLTIVCARSGFSSNAYFTAAFKKGTGWTPLEWRKAHS